METTKSEMSLRFMLPSVETKPTTIRKLRVALATRRPCSWTSVGSCGVASESLFCTCTCATSGSVPCSKVRVIARVPSLLLSDEKYSRLSSPDICCSMTWVTVFCTVSAEAPG